MRKAIRTTLKCLLILQISNRGNRINPYNPLSYIAITIALTIRILMFAFYEIWEENPNPFKWQ